MNIFMKEKLYMAEIMPLREYLSILEGTYPTSFRTLWTSLKKNNTQSVSQCWRALILNNK